MMNPRPIGIAGHLCPFALKEALLPALPDGARVVFVASGVEDPQRKCESWNTFPSGSPPPHQS